MSRVVYHGVLGGALASLLVGLAPIVAHADSQTKTYYAPAGDMLSPYGGATGSTADIMVKAACNQPGVESVCFNISGGATVHIDIADKTGMPTPGRVFFYDSSMSHLDGNIPQQICGSGDVNVLDGSAVMEVRIAVVGRGVWSTPPSPSEVTSMACGKPSPASTGTVTASGPGIGGSAAAASTSVPVSKAWSRAAAAVATARAAESTFRFARTARPL